MDIIETDDFTNDLKNIFGWKGRLKDAYWYVRGILFDRYNIIKLKGIGPTYIDPCEKFHMAIFQIVDDYLTKERGVKTYEERLEFLKGREKEIELSKESNDGFEGLHKDWYDAFKIMIENVHWYQTVYKLFNEDEEKYFKSIGIETVKRPKNKYTRIEGKRASKVEFDCSPEEEEKYLAYLKVTCEAEGNLKKELKERMKAIVDVYDALWS